MDPLGGSANGRPSDSDSDCLGSNPSPPANYFNDLAETTFLLSRILVAFLIGARKCEMLNYVDMDDFKVEKLRSGDQALADAIASVIASKQTMPVIVF